MLQPFALLLALAAEPSILTPEAAEHNRRAMVFYDAEQYAPAVEEFLKGYQSMPDVRRQRAGRLHMLGSMAMTLRDLHRQTGEVAPLCRLQALIRAHVDALTLAYPDHPKLQESVSLLANRELVMKQLAEFGPNPCEPPPKPVVAVESPPPPATPSPTAGAPPRTVTATPLPDRSDEIPPRHLEIAGGVTLGLGVALLGGVIHGVVTQQQQRAAAREFDARQPDRYITRAESDQLQEHLARAQFGHRLAIGTGLAAGVMTTIGTTFLVLARRSARARRWSAAPWWSTAGAGLTVQIQLGSSR